MEKYVELLAPAGSYEAFLGAVNAGADAVYLGGQQFGARAYADNFTTEEIVRALRIAHFYGKKIYLTVNTLLKEREMASLDQYLQPFYEAGLDGVIVQDFGVFCSIREHFPGLPLHVSTQMTVTGVRGAALLKELGACRIVPARELSLEEVRKIRKEADVEVECFIHGAMCYSYSGQCLFSSLLGGRSGNRGRCAQPCRLPYETCDGNERLSGSSYPLSLKDMCTLEYLPALLEAGMDSFKIEGRMKRPEYAAGVTAVYRKYIDLYYREGKDGYRVDPEDIDRLRRLYIRSEMQTGYYERHNGKEMITLEKPGYEGGDETLLAEIRAKYIGEPKKMPVRMKAQINVGEPMRLQVAAADRTDGGMSERGSRYDVKGGSETAEPGVKENRPETVCSAAERGRQKMVRLSVEVTGEIAQSAKKAPLSEEEVRKRLCKTGDSLLSVSNCEVFLEGACFVPVRALNEMRREAVAAFEAAVADSRGISVRQRAKECLENEFDREKNLDRPSQSMKYRSNDKMDRGIPAIAKSLAGDNGTADSASETIAVKKCVLEQSAGEKQVMEKPAVDVTVSTREQFGAALGWGGCRRIYIESDLFMKSFVEIIKMTGEAAERPKVREMPDFYLAMPYILRERDEAYLRRLQEQLEQAGPYVRGFLIRSLEELAWVREAARKWRNGRLAYEIVPDAGLYCFNADALEFFKGFSAEITLPYELNAGEAGHLVQAARERGIRTNLIVYSRIPMMITANCLQKTAGNCSAEAGGKRQLFLKDRLGRTFPVEINCDHCYNVIYNCVPYSLHGAWKERKRICADALRYDFTMEDGVQCQRILEGEIPFTDYTTGHCKRGVE